MRKYLSQTLIFAIVLLCNYSCKPEIEYSTAGSIYGVITDFETNNPIQGATVSFTPSNTSITTGSDGIYNLTGIEAQQYKITVTKSGYIFNSSYVDIIAGETIIKDVNISKEVEVVGFSIAPTALSFGTSYTSLTFSITNNSSLSSNLWSATVGNSDWLTLTPSSGKIEVGETTLVRADIDRSQILTDEMGFIILEANGGSKQILVSVSYSGSDINSNDNNSSANPDNSDDNQSEADGDGYIDIYTVEELSKIGVDSDYPLSGKYKLANNLTLSNYWIPIDDFTGIFDGDGHTISGLKINAMTDNQGLFGSVEKATIKDVILNSPSIKSTANNVGALVGYSGAYSIEGCSVIGGSVSGGKQVGGLIGNCTLPNYIKGSISSCSNSATVSGTANIGGIVGYLSIYDAHISITSSYNSGKVSGQSSLGGVVGYAYADFGSTTNISSCYNTGSVTSDNSSSIGGLVGFAYQYRNSTLTTSSCYNTANITGESFVGGIIGCSKPKYSPSTITTAFCYNTGTITGCGQYIGGVIGGVSDLSTSLDGATILASCYNTGAIWGYKAVGGIIGSPSRDVESYSCYFVDQSGDDATAGFGTETYVSDNTEKGSFSELNGSTVMNYMNSSSYNSYGSYTAGVPADTYLPSLMGEKVAY